MTVKLPALWKCYSKSSWSTDQGAGLVTSLLLFLFFYASLNCLTGLEILCFPATLTAMHHARLTRPCCTVTCFHPGPIRTFLVDEQGKDSTHLAAGLVCKQMLFLFTWPCLEWIRQWRWAAERELHGMWACCFQSALWCTPSEDGRNATWSTHLEDATPCLLWPVHNRTPTYNSELLGAFLVLVWSIGLASSILREPMWCSG